MNSVSFYQHQPQLAQACVVGIAALILRPEPGAHASLRVMRAAALVWSALGVLEFLVYAFGYQLAELTVRETQPIQAAILWLQLPALAVAVVAGKRAVTGR